MSSSSNSKRKKIVSTVPFKNCRTFRYYDENHVEHIVYSTDFPNLSLTERIINIIVMVLPTTLMIGYMIFSIFSTADTSLGERLILSIFPLLFLAMIIPFVVSEIRRIKICMHDFEEIKSDFVDLKDIVKIEPAPGIERISIDGIVFNEM